MTARQFLLTESQYCRARAAGCADRYIARELHRLADWFEMRAANLRNEQAPAVHSTVPQGMVVEFPSKPGTGYNPEP